MSSVHMTFFFELQFYQLFYNLTNVSFSDLIKTCYQLFNYTLLIIRPNPNYIGIDLSRHIWHTWIWEEIWIIKKNHHNHTRIQKINTSQFNLDMTSVIQSMEYQSRMFSLNINPKLLFEHLFDAKEWKTLRQLQISFCP